MGAKAIIVNTPENTIQSDAQDWASIFNSILGETSGIVEYGRKMEAQKVNDNSIKLLDGVYSMQGHVIKIDKDSFVQLTIESGTLGMNRKDAVIVEYNKSVNPDANDTFEFKVIRGTPKAQGTGDPELPNLIVQDLHAGGSKRQECLFEVLVTNDSIFTIGQVADSLNTMADVKSLIGAVDALQILNVELSLINGWHIEKYADGRLKMWKEYTESIVFALSPGTTNYYRGTTTISNELYPVQFVNKGINLAVNVFRFAGAGGGQNTWNGRSETELTKLNQVILLADRAVTQEVHFAVVLDGFWK